MIAIVAITIYTSYSDYEKIASGYIAAYSHRHFADGGHHEIINEVIVRLYSFFVSCVAANLPKCLVIQENKRKEK